MNKLTRLQMMALAMGVEPSPDADDMTDDEFLALIDGLADEPEPVMAIELRNRAGIMRTTAEIENMLADHDRAEGFYQRPTPHVRGTKPKKSRAANRRRNKASRKARRENR